MYNPIQIMRYAETHTTVRERGGYSHQLSSTNKVIVSAASHKKKVKSFFAGLLTFSNCWLNSTPPLGEREGATLILCASAWNILKDNRDNLGQLFLFHAETQRIGVAPSIELEGATLRG